MEEIINKIFVENHYREIWHEENTHFYVNETKAVSYYLVTYIDCSSDEMNNQELKGRLSKLEIDYIDNENGKVGIRKSLQEVLGHGELGQLDKNTSAIYLLKIKKSEDLENYRNLIYSIEESPYYFRRYILPYTEKQQNELKEVMKNNSDKNMVEILSDLANCADEYYLMLENKNLDRVYELVIRIFSKIPFLQYSFKAETKPLPLEDSINIKLENSDLRIYHEAIITGEKDIEKWLALGENSISDDKIESVLIEYMRGGN